MGENGNEQIKEIHKIIYCDYCQKRKEVTIRILEEVEGWGLVTVGIEGPREEVIYELRPERKELDV